MTMFSKSEVIDNLRAKNKDLEMKIERVKAVAFKWDHHDDAGCLEKLKQTLEEDV